MVLLLSDANVLLPFGFSIDPSGLPPAACFPEGADDGDTDSQDDVEELLVREADDFAAEEIASVVSSAGEEEEPEQPPPAAAPEPAQSRQRQCHLQTSPRHSLA